MPLRVAVINGPNLNMLGLREPEIYGSETLAQLEARTVEWGRGLDVDVATFQSNHEGAIIDRIHACRTEADAIVINPGALTHTSYAIHDALLAVALPAVEVHLSDVHAREPWRSVSVIAPAVVRSIFGRGSAGYRDALRLLVNRAAAPWETVAYGDHPEQVMDVRHAASPPAARARVAVFLHGGFWRREWGRDTIDTLAVDLANRGWATVNVEYRRLGCDGGWPVTGDDVAAAVDRVVDLTDSRPGHARSGTRRGASSPWWRDGPDGRERSWPWPRSPTCAGRSSRGSERPARSGSWADADPAGPISPITDPVAVPHLIVHGTGDDVVPVDFSTRYVEAAAGTEVTAVYPEVGHFSLLSPDEPGWALVTDWLADESGLRPTPPPTSGTG